MISKYVQYYTFSVNTEKVVLYVLLLLFQLLLFNEMGSTQFVVRQKSQLDGLEFEFFFYG